MYQRRIYEFRGKAITFIVNAIDCEGDEIINILKETAFPKSLGTLYKEIQTGQLHLCDMQAFISLNGIAHDLANDYISGHMYKDAKDYLTDDGVFQLDRCCGQAKKKMSIYNKEIQQDVLSDLADLETIGIHVLKPVCDL